LNGVVQPVTLTERERVTIRLPAAGLGPDATQNSATTDAERKAEDEEGNDLMDEVDRFLDDNDAEDEEDAPDWEFEEGEVKSKNPNYVFCPAPHRKQLLHLFTKHFCQHPIFPERGSTRLSAEEIRTNAVTEMYQFCYQRGLSEVWAYMWTSWYQPKVWKLWARSSSPWLSRLRTTMTVENFWRQLKHEFLHHFLRPRLDLLVWILIYNVTPAYVARAEVLEDTHRLGRSNKLTSYQVRFKTAWKKLAQLPVSGLAYNIDLAMFTCDCGRQKYEAHHLCKHLVRAVSEPDIRFWRHVVRRRRAPLYRHHHLLPSGYPESPDNGTITDGDDHVWTGDVAMLSGGRWRTITTEQLIGKRTRDSDSEEPEMRSSSPVTDSDRSIYDLAGGDDEAREEEVCIICLLC